MSAPRTQRAGRWGQHIPLLAGRDSLVDETLATLLIELAELHHNHRDPTLLAGVANRLIRLGRQRALLQARTAGHLALGKAYIAQAQLTRARRHLTLALRLAQQSDLANLEAATLAALGHLGHLQGDKACAQRLFEAALAHYRHLEIISKSLCHTCAAQARSRATTDFEIVS